MKTIKTNVPESLKEIKNDQTMTESDAFKEANRINSTDSNHQAKVENGELKVQQVLKG